MATTRVVVAVVALPVFLATVVAVRRDRELTARWLLALGSGLAAVWAGLGALKATTVPGRSPDVELALTMTAGATAYYFFRTAVDMYTR